MMNIIGEIILGILIIYFIIWIIIKINSVDKSLKIIAKNFEILTKNLKTYHESKEEQINLEDPIVMDYPEKKRENITKIG